MTTPRSPKKTETLEVRMPHEAKRAFLEACRAEGRTASEVVRDFVEDYLRRAAQQERHRDPVKPERSFAMIFLTRPALLAKGARRTALAAGVGALGLIAMTVSPSAAELDFRTMFDRLDADRDGRITAEEFAAPQAAGGDVMMFVRSERVETLDGQAVQDVTESAEEFWLPASPPVDGAAPTETRREVRVMRQVEDGEVITEQVAGVPLDGAAFADLREREFARFDDDEDGAVDYTEFETRHTTMIGNTFRRLDADGDGALAADELDAIPVALGLDDLPPPVAADLLASENFARLDRDGDGSVTLDEFAAGPGTP